VGFLTAFIAVFRAASVGDVDQLVDMDARGSALAEEISSVLTQLRREKSQGRAFELKRRLKTLRKKHAREQTRKRRFSNSQVEGPSLSADPADSAESFEHKLDDLERRKLAAAQRYRDGWTFGGGVSAPARFFALSWRSLTSPF